MAGIYIHIPFCKQKCHYCDFHFSTRLSYRSEMVKALCRELMLRRRFFSTDRVTTVYLGGGTPSVLTASQWQQLMDAITDHYDIAADAELTVECNPDDLDEEKLHLFHSLGVNRLSIGVQSFDDRLLRQLNRSHTAGQAENAIRLAVKEGFDNLTVDLMYGLPKTDHLYWADQIQRVLRFGIPHLSAYCLTIESNTVFHHLHQKGTLQLPDDEEGKTQFAMVMDRLQSAGFEQYEISNFALPGYVSKHNSGYWLQQHYLGIGPSAHSYDGTSRGWNVAHNQEYINALANDRLPYTSEQLTPRDQLNDYLLSRLRTKWGVELKTVEQLASGLNVTAFRKALNQHLERGNLVQREAHLICLSEQGKYLADRVISDLFVV